MEIPVYQIDSGVPIPEGNDTQVPLNSLEVGDSVLFPVGRRKTVQSNASTLKRRHGKEFTIRKMDDGFCRVWRTK